MGVNLKTIDVQSIFLSTEVVAQSGPKKSRITGNQESDQVLGISLRGLGAKDIDEDARNENHITNCKSNRY